MKYLKDEKVRKNLFTGSCLIVLFFVIYNIKYIWGAAGKLIDIFVPFIVGAAIAFVLNVPMRWIEKGILRNRQKFSGAKWDGIRRALALIITLLLAVVIISLILYMVIPQLGDTIGQLVRQIPLGIEKLNIWADNIFSTQPIIQQAIDSLAQDWQSILEKLMGYMKNIINSALEGGLQAVTGIVSGVISFVVGFIFSLYILVQKEKLGDQAKKIIYAVFSRETADEIMAVGRMSSKTFANFISGQCMEAVILSGMFCITMTILRLPYAMLIGVLIGVMNLIPIVGAFIGCGIGALLILLVDPMKALIFLVAFIILQQIEGNLIYPKVVGDSVGLPGIWVLVSVTVGGSLFGVKGMVVFIPLVSVMYSLFRRGVYSRLQKKELLEGYELITGVGEVEEIEIKRKQPEESQQPKKQRTRRNKNRNK
ncbi:MAG TPA: AI-2E family transporter [Lachnospiraceae bacterium]|nr:AI-2E family transporter [Lachnospiraceae bacterium]